jgi:hypothetical protein
MGLSAATPLAVRAWLYPQLSEARPRSHRNGGARSPGCSMPRVSSVRRCAARLGRTRATRTTRCGTRSRRWWPGTTPRAFGEAPPVAPASGLGAGFCSGRVVEQRLGAGGMGEVYRVRDTKLGRDVAIKVLPDSHFAKVSGAQNGAHRNRPLCWARDDAPDFCRCQTRCCGPVADFLETFGLEDLLSK